VTTLVIGAFYVLLIYSGVVGFGLTPHGLHQLQNDSTPFQTLGRSFSGPALGTLSVIAVMSSFIALNIVTVTAGSRMVFAMGRDRLLPRWFDHVNRRGAPDRAILAIATVFLAITLVLGSIYTPGDLASWAAYIATLFFIAAYALLCLGVVKYYWDHHRSEFNPWRHVIVPIAGLVGVGIVTYGNVHPTPPSPLRWFIWATVGTIVGAGLVSLYLERRNPRLLVEAGQVFAQSGPDEDSARAGSGTRLSGEAETSVTARRKADAAGH
jgi:amino acid transporter